jgi:hypothetical protein
MEIRFNIDPERMTLGDLIMLESGAASSWRERRDTMANHMVDEGGNFIEPGRAREILSALNLKQLGDVGIAFVAKVRELEADQLPPQSGT